MIENVLSEYGISNAIVQPYGNGLINSTWKIKDDTGDYILQKINHQVFKTPQDITDNIQLIAGYLQQHHPDYFFVSPVLTQQGKGMVTLPGEGFFRLFPFVKNSKTYDVVATTQQAFEAARQFGLFTKSLNGLHTEKLKITLPDFHNLSLRYEQFLHACTNGNKQRIQQAQSAIALLHQYSDIVTTYKKITRQKEFNVRITHHDTKISNVLFNGDKGICVIDLDTVMPGYFISDIGDMMRTYLSPVSEEEKDFSKINVREDFFEAIVQGYLESMADELNATELSHFVYSGLFLIYMQAVRFLTDHLNNDVYYGAAYEGQNFIRAQNQLCLLENLLDKEKLLTQMVDKATTHFI